MGSRKAVFFDIDGTLLDGYMDVPKSAAEAIGRMRKNGHLAFINSGRTRGFISNPALMAIGFDGIVSGCGTMIEWNGEGRAMEPFSREGDIVFCHEIEPALAERAITTVRHYGMRPVLEGRNHLYFDDDEFGEDPYGLIIKADMGDRLLQIKDNWLSWEISKFSCDTRNADTAACCETLADSFTPLSHDSTVTEFVPNGFSKGSGIVKVCELLGIGIEDTIAVGDSVNDLDMLKVAGVSVAMGNGSDAAKEASDMVTSAISEDGIKNALLELGLI